MRKQQDFIKLHVKMDMESRVSSWEIFIFFKKNINKLENIISMLAT